MFQQTGSYYAKFQLERYRVPSVSSGPNDYFLNFKLNNSYLLITSSVQLKGLEEIYFSFMRMNI